MKIRSPIERRRRVGISIRNPRFPEADTEEEVKRRSPRTHERLGSGEGHRERMEIVGEDKSINELI